MNAGQDGSPVSLRYRLVALSAGIPATMCFTIIIPILPKMETALAHDATDALLVKMVVAINGLAMAVGAPLGGYLADRIGRGVLLSWSMVIWAILGFSGYFIDDLKLMVGSRFLVGIVTSTAATVGVTMIGDIPDQAMRNKLIGLATTVMAGTGVVILPISGMLGDIHWRVPFFLYLACLPLAMFAWTVMRNVGFRTARAPAVRAEGDPPFPWPWGIMLLAFLIGVISTANVTYMPFALRDLGATSSTQIATAISCKSAIIATMAALYGYGRSYMSVHMALAVALVMAAVGAFFVASAGSFLFGAVALLVWGVGMGWFSPSITTRATEAATTETRGRVIGLVKGVQFSASFPSVLLLEPVLRQGGPRAVLMVCSGVAAVLAFYYLARYRFWPMLRRTRPLQTKRVPHA